MQDSPIKIFRPSSTSGRACPGHYAGLNEVLKISPEKLGDRLLAQSDGAAPGGRDELRLDGSAVGLDWAFRVRWPLRTAASEIGVSSAM